MWPNHFFDTLFRQHILSQSGTTECATAVHFYRAWRPHTLAFISYYLNSFTTLVNKKVHLKNRLLFVFQTCKAWNKQAPSLSSSLSLSLQKPVQNPQRSFIDNHMKKFSAYLKRLTVISIQRIISFFHNHSTLIDPWSHRSMFDSFLKVKKA